MLEQTYKKLGAAERRRIFGLFLDRACQRSDLSRKQLAEQLELSVGTVNAYLKGSVDPLHTRLIIQQRLAQLNGLNLEELFAVYCRGSWQALPEREPVLLRPLIRPLRRGHQKAWQQRIRPCRLPATKKPTLTAA